MSATIGIVRVGGFVFRVPKTAFETDEQLQDRTWWYAKNPNATIADTLKWRNRKYFNMKYIDDDGSGSQDMGTRCVGTDS